MKDSAPKEIPTRGQRKWPHRFPRRAAGKLSVVAAALLLTFFQLPESWIERFYANGLYPHVQAAVTPVSNLLPFALYDVLLVTVILGLPVWWVRRLVKAGKGRRLRRLGTLIVNTIVLAAISYLLFQFLWGLNYMRRPLKEKFDYDAARINEDAAVQLYRLAVERLNTDVLAAHQTELPDDAEWRRRLQPAYDALVKELGPRTSLTLARPKATLFDRYLEKAGITGFINPFGHETIVAKGFHPLDRGFTLAHEWGHLAGFADESEASFIGLLALLRSEDATARYAGWLELYRSIPLRKTRLEELNRTFTVPLPQLAEPVKEDLRAMAEEAAKRKISERISRAQWQMYEQFLKANNATPNYGEVISLVMGTKFDPAWQPIRKAD